MTKFTVEKIRITYASGKYDMLGLFLLYKDSVNCTDIIKILDYSAYPEVKSELKQRIIEVPIAQNYYKEYQEALRELVCKAEAMELSGSKHYPFKEYADTLLEVLSSNMENLEMISINELRSFYIPDEGLCE